mgnify:CR=1 FL=1
MTEDKPLFTGMMSNSAPFTTEEKIAELIEKGYVGLDADFEYIPETDRDAFFAFLDNARERLHQYGFFLQVDLAPKTCAQQPGLLYVAHDYAGIGSIADTVLLMTYEWGYAYGPPMAIAPLPQVEAVVRSRRSRPGRSSWAFRTTGMTGPCPTNPVGGRSLWETKKPSVWPRRSARRSNLIPFLRHLRFSIKQRAPSTRYGLRMPAVSRPSLT